MLWCNSSFRVFALEVFNRCSKNMQIENGEENGYFLILRKQRTGAIIWKDPFDKEKFN